MRAGQINSWLLAGALWLLATSHCVAGDLANCDLATPPAKSGEIAFEGEILRIYPRTPDMKSNYSGCQTVWAKTPEETGWRKISEARFVGGTITVYTALGRYQKPPLVCEYSNGALRTGIKGCPTFSQANAREESLPPGCLDEVARSGRDADEPACVRELK